LVTKTRSLPALVTGSSDQITSPLPRFMPGKKFKMTLEQIEFEKA
jgi:hypothetical protein